MPSQQSGRCGPRAAICAPTKHEECVTFARSVLASFKGNSALPNPPIALDKFEGHIDEYALAVLAVVSRTAGTVDTRAAKRRLVMDDLHHFCDYVNSVVEKATSPADAVTVIIGSGFKVRRIGKAESYAFRADHGKLPGVVELEARRVAPVATYYWQYSQDGVTWIDAPDTFQASTTITGLTSGQTYQFRFYAKTRNGQTPMSPVVTLMVH